LIIWLKRIHLTWQPGVPYMSGPNWNS
jgi:hypothetical protein